MTPVEILGDLQADENTTLDDVREIYDGFLRDGFTGRDIIGNLYGAMDPPSHEDAQYVTWEGHIRANVFDQPLPLPDNAFETVLADHPGKTSQQPRAGSFSMNSPESLPLVGVSSSTLGGFRRTTMSRWM